jgi:hypothetical protein
MNATGRFLKWPQATLSERDILQRAQQGRIELSWHVKDGRITVTGRRAIGWHTPVLSPAHSHRTSIVTNSNLSEL